MARAVKLKFERKALIRALGQRMREEAAKYKTEMAEYKKQRAKAEAVYIKQVADALRKASADVRKTKSLKELYNLNGVEAKRYRSIDVSKSVYDVEGIDLAKPSEPPCRKAQLAMLKASTEEEISLSEQQFVQLVGSDVCEVPV